MFERKWLRNHQEGEQESFFSYKHLEDTDTPENRTHVPHVFIRVRYNLVKDRVERL